MEAEIGLTTVDSENVQTATYTRSDEFESVEHVHRARSGCTDVIGRSRKKVVQNVHCMPTWEAEIGSRRVHAVHVLHHFLS